MIPWVREKIAERKARWQQSRKQQRDAAAAASTTPSGSPSSGSSSSVLASPAGSSNRGSSARNFRFSSKLHGQQQQATTSTDRLNCCNVDSGRGATASCGVTSGEDHQQFRQTIPLKIISPRGGIVALEMSRDSTGTQLKTQALESFACCSFSLPHFSSDLNELVERYKLIRARNRVVFQDTDTLEQLNVRAEEEFMLVVKRTDFIPPEESVKGPTISEVLAATKHIPLSRSNQSTSNLNLALLQTDLQQDLRRILISLARASAFVIGSGACADKLIALFRQRLINRRRHQVRSIETLLEMGFSLDKIHQALEITKNIFPAALDWLIQNDSSVKLLNCDRTSPSPKEVGNVNNEATTSSREHNNGLTQDLAERNIEQPRNTSTDSSSRTPSPTNEALAKQEGTDEDTETKFLNKIENVNTLLDIIRQYADRDVYPSSETVASIVEMGFSERNVREALIMTRNNQAAACEWLLGNRSKSLTELRNGMSTESPILQVLLASPQVQISLGNPKMFIALLSMLDNSSTMTMWLSDNETSAVLGHILRTYHEEKHIVAINQFSNAQSFN
ncbi:ubiquitin-associated domain-containing protein 1 [Topomyia yanbarensis]|uniref:ubiquitin-associated domain-containing protein 1 n=1 Tax=Topomyia yanbarensis TaxID=2498891 RepID=UPI00273B2187|nr:ubiquitin-associated domain-containing protein 1 [Topomyia yanbarensis]